MESMIRFSLFFSFLFIPLLGHPKGDKKRCAPSVERFTLTDHASGASYSSVNHGAHLNPRSTPDSLTEFENYLLANSPSSFIPSALKDKFTSHELKEIREIISDYINPTEDQPLHLIRDRSLLIEDMLLFFQNYNRSLPPFDSHHVIVEELQNGHQIPSQATSGAPLVLFNSQDLIASLRKFTERDPSFFSDVLPKVQIGKEQGQSIPKKDILNLLGDARDPIEESLLKGLSYHDSIRIYWKLPDNPLAGLSLTTAFHQMRLSYSSGLNVLDLFYDFLESPLQEGRRHPLLTLLSVQQRPFEIHFDGHQKAIYISPFRMHSDLRSSIIYALAKFYVIEFNAAKKILPLFEEVKDFFKTHHPGFHEESRSGALTHFFLNDDERYFLQRQIEQDLSLFLKSGEDIFHFERSYHIRNLDEFALMHDFLQIVMELNALKRRYRSQNDRLYEDHWDRMRKELLDSQTLFYKKYWDDFLKENIQDFIKKFEERAYL